MDDDAGPCAKLQSVPKFSDSISPGMHEENANEIKNFARRVCIAKANERKSNTSVVDYPEVENHLRHALQEILLLYLI